MNHNPKLTDDQSTKIEAALFRKLVDHLQRNPEVQNIDLMNLAYFCRNCFSKWYVTAAAEQGVEVDYDEAREVIYGMSFSQYKSEYQEKASEEQLEKFQASQTMATE